MHSYYKVEVANHLIEVRCHGFGRWGVFGPEEIEVAGGPYIRARDVVDVEVHEDGETHQRP